jgi:AraC family transcriptional regulator of adaptative response/methylated-DNA-[protein]-cysteine methyltransferase
MEAAYQRRDASYDGVFYLGVRTTGIFCRPSCPARKPLARNVEYFGSVKDALFAGYRPCKRCRPLEVRRAFQQLRQGVRLDEVAMSHGFESHSGFRDAFGRLVGRAPGRSRALELVTVSWLQSPLGPLVAGVTDRGVCLLEFSDRRMLEAQFESLRQRLGPVLPGPHPLLEQLRSELAEYFGGSRREFMVPLVYPGTPFQVRVWEALRGIPYGETYSYEKLAWSVGTPRAQRAVGHANGQNRLAILIPCHRVVNKDGKLGGYGGGLWRKQMLLDLERGQLTALVQGSGRMQSSLSGA